MTAPGTPPSPQADSRRRDTELIVAVFRTIFLLIVLFSPQFRQAQVAGAMLAPAAVIAAACYNLVLFILHVRGLPFPRWLIVAVDVVLVTLWIYLCGQGCEAFFAFYYAVVIVSGLWFGVVGAFSAAVFASALYVWAVAASAPSAAAGMIGKAMLQVVLLIVTAGIVSIAAELQARERQALATSRAVLQQYRERIQVAQYVDDLVRPRRLPVAPGLDIGFQYRPAAVAFSGDYYDLIPLGGRRWGLCIADLSGQFSERIGYLHTFKTTLRITARQEQSPARVLTQINREVTAAIEETADTETFISMAYLLIDLEAGTLTYSNAGHEPPVLMRASGGEPTALSDGGIVLGVLPETTYQEALLPLHLGDTLVLFTDGMTEVMDRRQRFLGREGLLAIVESHLSASTAAEVATQVFEAVVEYGSGGRRRDDMTLLVARVTATDLGGGAAGSQASG